jgi:hypothetical protein
MSSPVTVLADHLSQASTMFLADVAALWGTASGYVPDFLLSWLPCPNKEWSLTLVCLCHMDVLLSTMTQQTSAKAPYQVFLGNFLWWYQTLVFLCLIAAAVTFTFIKQNLQVQTKCEEVGFFPTRIGDFIIIYKGKISAFYNIEYKTFIKPKLKM